MNNPQIPVVELLRVSTAGQGKDDRAGIPRQIEANRQTIKRHSLKVLKTFKLIDVSGTSIMHTPELLEMLELIKAGKVRGIVLADFDRLLRPDDFRSLAILQDIKETQTLLYLPDQIIDLNTQSGFLMSGLQSVIAGNELAQIKKRMMGAKEEKRRQGKCPGTEKTLPLGVGYDRKKEKYFYTETAAKVRELFTLFHHRRIHNLHELERLTGIQHRTIANLLRNELYIGYRHYKEKRSTKTRYRTDGRRADKPKVHRLPHETIRVKVIDQPLIDEGIFWDVQKTLKNKRKEYTHRRIQSKNHFLFAGHLKCSLCEDPMYTVPGGKAGTVKDYYYCRRKSHHFRKKGYPSCPSSFLKRKFVEDLVLRFVSTKMTRPEYIVDQLSSLYDHSQEDCAQKKILELKKRVRELKKKKTKILDLYIQGLFSETEIREKAEEIQKEIDRIGEELEKIDIKPEKAKPEDYIDDCIKISEAFSEFIFWDKDQQKEYLDILQPTFFVGPDGITKFSIPVSKNRNRTDRDSWLPPA